MPKGPKKKCCTSKPKCGRCPLRMLAEGRLPAGLTVKKRKLVKVKGSRELPQPTQTRPQRKGRKSKGLPQAA